MKSRKSSKRKKEIPSRDPRPLNSHNSSRCSVSLMALCTIRFSMMSPAHMDSMYKGAVLHNSDSISDGDLQQLSNDLTAELIRHEKENRTLGTLLDHLNWRSFLVTINTLIEERVKADPYKWIW